jgi:pyridoxal phosphate enzyme (YggS family)
MTRRDELERNLRSVREEIERACLQVHRDPSEITIIAVTKNFPSSDIRILHELGMTNFGESKVQEFAQKFDDLADLVATWHFIGTIQSNKIKELVRIAQVIHSVDSAQHVEKMNSLAAGIEKVMTLLIQVNLDPDFPNNRGGIRPHEIEKLAQHIEALANVRLAGLMFIASPLLDTQRAFEGFSEALKAFQASHSNASLVSAGMSADIEEAIAIGATHLRIGSKLLGNRPL